MKDINEVILKLKMFADKADPEDPEAALIKAMKEVDTFYQENLYLNEEEVSILLTNEDKTVLSYACPEYLVNSGMIPVNSTEAFTASIFRNSRSIIENNLSQQKHLSIFEVIRTPDGKVKPFWKMMGTVIAVENDKIGVIEIARRSPQSGDAGEDFNEKELKYLEQTIRILAPHIKRLMPKNFRGRVT